MKLLEITEIKTLPFFAPNGGDSLEARIKKVPLRGINGKDGEPVKVYEHARLEIRQLTPEELRQHVFTGQLMIYQTHLDFLAQLEKLLHEKTGEKLTSISKCYEFTSRYIDEKGEEQTSHWTLIPPIVEENLYTLEGALNGRVRYEDLRKHLPEELALNPLLKEYEFGKRRYKVVFPIICDGAHRVYLAYQRKEPITVAYLSNVLEGFPYYAHPQPYDKTKVVPSHDHEHDPEYADLQKVHVFDGQHSKRLYRLFPAAGLYTGGVRPDAVLKK